MSKKFKLILSHCICVAVAVAITVVCCYQYTKDLREQLKEATTALSEDKKPNVLVAGDATYTMNVPEGFSDLTSEYRTNMMNYYGITMNNVNMFTVGDSGSTGSSQILMNASTVDSYKEILAQLKSVEKDSIKDEELSPAYYYHVNNKVVDNAPDNYKIELLEEFKVDKSVVKVYKESYDLTQEYTVSGNETESYTTHCFDVIAYTDSSNPLEVICYIDEDKVDQGVKYIKDMFGAK